MKARLIKDVEGSVRLLLEDGSFSYGSLPLLAKFFLNFTNIESFTGRDGSWRDSAADMALYPGETIAIVNDRAELTVFSGEIFSDFFDSSMSIEDYISTEEYAKIHDKTPEIIKLYCREGRIPAQKVGRAWMIPKDAPYPVHPRRQRPKTCGPRAAEKFSKK